MERGVTPPELPTVLMGIEYCFIVLGWNDESGEFSARRQKYQSANLFSLIAMRPADRGKKQHDKSSCSVQIDID